MAISDVPASIVGIVCSEFAAISEGSCVGTKVSKLRGLESDAPFAGASKALWVLVPFKGPGAVALGLDLSFVGGTLYQLLEEFNQDGDEGGERMRKWEHTEGTS